MWWCFAAYPDSSDAADCIMTEGGRVHMVSGKNCKCILLYITGECKLFLILFSYKDMEKKKPHSSNQRQHVMYLSSY